MVLNTESRSGGIWNVLFFWNDFEAKVPGSMSIIAQEPGDRIDRYLFLAGWWLTYPSEKYEIQLGWWHSQYIMETSIKIH